MQHISDRNKYKEEKKPSSVYFILRRSKKIKFTFHFLKTQNVNQSIKQIFGAFPSSFFGSPTENRENREYQQTKAER
jgi:hypothetical protein